MQNDTSPDRTRISTPDIRRITGPGMEAGYIISEVFRARMIITSEMRKTFLQDPARFMARFFEQRGHRVNGFNITVTADERVRRLVSASTTDTELEEIVVHVVQGGVSSEPGLQGEYSVSQYL